MGELYLHDLTKFIDEFGCKVFIETGTATGLGTEYACGFPFDRLYSIELDTDLYEVNVESLLDERLVLVNESSLVGIQQILKSENDDPILYWLDAHFPGCVFGMDDYEDGVIPDTQDVDLCLPLDGELNSIRELRDHTRDCFIIDDLRMYEEGNFELGNLPSNLLSIMGGYDNKFLLDYFAPTHNLMRDYRHQGFLIATPKNGENNETCI